MLLYMSEYDKNSYDTILLCFIFQMALSLPASALGAKPNNTNTTVQSNLLPKPIQPAHVKVNTTGAPGSASSLLVS